jgi:DeoR family transcriptional regulator, fructose operon transcriptional repressor
VTDSLSAFAPARRERVAQIVRARRAVRVEDLRSELGVSLATIRRDLDELEAQGSLRRVHGGAVSTDERPVERRFDAKAEAHAQEKRRIAACAATLIEPEETVYLDGGSTVLELARRLVDRDDLTVVTNSLPAIVELAGRGPRLVVIGGELRPLSQAIVGPLSRLLLERLYVDRAFIGTFGLSLDAGLTTSDPAEAYTKELVLGRSRQVVLLADAGKLGTRSFAHAGRLDQVDLLVTDAPLTEHAAATFDRAGVRVLIA